MIEKQQIRDFPANTNKENVYNTVDSLGCLQIDTINVIERAHYMTLWSRLGDYDKQHLDELTYRDRKLFEYWAHAASFVPFKDYRYYLHAMKKRNKEIRARFTKRTGKPPKVMDEVLKRIKDEGALASKDFDAPKRKGGWWNRKTEKTAMDYMYGAGILLVDKRVNFQRYYDLAENIIPSGIDLSPPFEDERVEFFTRKTIQCLGAIKPVDVRKYYHHWSVNLGRTSKEIEIKLENMSDVVALDVENDKTKYYCLEGDAERIENLDDDFGFDNVRLIVYFDNFMWNRERIQELFGFIPKLEIYLPVPEREYGYYHLPVLYGDTIVARLEPKMDRKENKLIVRGYWTEPSFTETEDYQDKLVKNLEDLAAFHGTKEIEWLC